MKKQFTPGDRVLFDDVEHGPQEGRLIGFTVDIGNGCRTAVVEVNHSLRGIVWHVPAAKLRLLQAAA